ncbi:MAG TPA: hypothetical protein VJA27_02150 [Patescibacteria group bacterium]|nr:hypothetical protein [Patescibacteria group bacterium]
MTAAAEKMEMENVPVAIPEDEATANMVIDKTGEVPLMAVPETPEELSQERKILNGHILRELSALAPFELDSIEELAWTLHGLETDPQLDEIDPLPKTWSADERREKRLLQRKNIMTCLRRIEIIREERAATERSRAREDAGGVVTVEERGRKGDITKKEEVFSPLHTKILAGAMAESLQAVANVKGMLTAAEKEKFRKAIDDLEEKLILFSDPQRKNIIACKDLLTQLGAYAGRSV